MPITKLGSVAEGFGSGVVTVDATHTLEAGSDRIIIAIAGVEDGTVNPAITGIVYDQGGDNIPMIGLTGATVFNGQHQGARMFYLLEASLPTNGAKTVRATASSNMSRFQVEIICIQDAKQSAPEADETNTATDVATITKSITTLTDLAWIISGDSIGDDVRFSSHGAGQIEEADFGSGGTGLCLTTEEKATAGADTQSHTAASSQERHVMVLAAFAPIFDQTLSPTGISSAEAFGSPNISLRTLGVTGILSAEAFGIPNIIKRQGAIVFISDQKPVLVTPGFSDYKVRLKDQSGVLVAEFDAWRSLSFSHIINSPGACRLEIDATDPRAALFELDGQIEVWRRNLDVGLDWYIEWEGFHRTQNDLVQQNDNESFVSYALGYLTLLNRRHIMYFAGTAQTDKSGAGETVIKEFVLQNAGADALSANGRLGSVDANIAGLTIEADQGNGSNWDGARAYKNLLTVAAEIAVSTGVDIELVGVGATAYEFRVLNGQRTDRTITGLDIATGLNAAGNAPVIFALGFGNMALPLFSINRSTEANAVYALGQGEQSSRTVVLREDLDAIANSPINRIEIIRNATQQSDTDGLNSVGDEALVENQKKETLRFNALQIEGTFYGKDYFWGDLITARYRTSEFNKKIVDVRVTVSNTQGGETITLEFADIP